MVSVEEATQIIHSKLLKTSRVAIEFTQAVGRVLAEDIVADRDLPPFDRATMDGVAVSSASLSQHSTLLIQSVQAAGEPQQTLVSHAHCIEIMTGAMLPKGTDTIIPYEQVEIKDGTATLPAGVKIERGQNIHPQGADARKGEKVMKAGIRISPAEVALFASVGKNDVSVMAWPKVAIISTGNELVDVTATPLPHQIRKSNSYALQAALKSIGCPSTVMHLPDDKPTLELALRELVTQQDVIILSGGVSKGKYDFVPQVLATIGIEKHIHQVAQKPGKPFWFGSKGNTFVFGLPGNPVSTYLCYYRYILPWLWHSLGAQTPDQKAILAEDFMFKPPLTCFLQAAIKNENGRWMAYPCAGGGSGDFANLVKADGFLELPNHGIHFKKGDVFSWISFRPIHHLI